MITALLPACVQAVTLPDAPAWLQARIEGYAKATPGTAPTAVWQTTVAGKTAYYLAAACCDQFNPLLDADGNFICAPDGGFTGRGDGKCSETPAPEQKMKLLWQDPRLAKPPVEGKSAE